MASIGPGFAQGLASGLEGGARLAMSRAAQERAQEGLDLRREEIQGLQNTRQGELAVRRQAVDNENAARKDAEAQRIADAARAAYSARASELKTLMGPLNAMTVRINALPKSDPSYAAFNQQYAQLQQRVQQLQQAQYAYVNGHPAVQQSQALGTRARQSAQALNDGTADIGAMPFPDAHAMFTQATGVPAHELIRKNGRPTPFDERLAALHKELAASAGSNTSDFMKAYNGVYAPLLQGYVGHVLHDGTTVSGAKFGLPVAGAQDGAVIPTVELTGTTPDGRIATYRSPFMVPGTNPPAVVTTPLNNIAAHAAALGIAAHAANTPQIAKRILGATPAQRAASQNMLDAQAHRNANPARLAQPPVPVNASGMPVANAGMVDASGGATAPGAALAAPTAVAAPGAALAAPAAIPAGAPIGYPSAANQTSTAPQNDASFVPADGYLTKDAATVTANELSRNGVTRYAQPVFQGKTKLGYTVGTAPGAIQAKEPSASNEVFTAAQLEAPTDMTLAGYGSIALGRMSGAQRLQVEDNAEKVLTNQYTQITGRAPTHAELEDQYARIKNYPQTREVFTTRGAVANQLAASATAFLHLSDMVGLVKGAFSKVGSVPFTPANFAWREALQAFGNPTVTDFKSLKSVVSGEISKFYDISTEGERAELKDALSSAATPNQLVGVINTYRRAMYQKLRVFNNMWNIATPVTQNALFTQMLPAGVVRNGYIDFLYGRGGDFDPQLLGELVSDDKVSGTASRIRAELPAQTPTTRAKAFGG